MVPRSFTSASKVVAADSSDCSREAAGLPRPNQMDHERREDPRMLREGEREAEAALDVFPHPRSGCPAASVFSVCSERIVSVRMSDRPDEIMVAIWRLMTARSLSFTPFWNRSGPISICKPVLGPAGATSTGDSPIAAQAGGDPALAGRLEAALVQLAGRIPARVRERLRRHQRLTPWAEKASPKSGEPFTPPVDISERLTSGFEADRVLHLLHRDRMRDPPRVDAGRRGADRGCASRVSLPACIAEAIW